MFQVQSTKIYGKVGIYIFLIFPHNLNKYHHYGVTHRNYKQAFTNSKLHIMLYLRVYIFHKLPQTNPQYYKIYKRPPQFHKILQYAHICI